MYSVLGLNDPVKHTILAKSNITLPDVVSAISSRDLATSKVKHILCNSLAKVNFLMVQDDVSLK